MDTTFNVFGNKEKVNALIETVRNMVESNPISDQFSADAFEKNVNLTTSNNKVADFIVEYCEDNNIHCEFI